MTNSHDDGQGKGRLPKSSTELIKQSHHASASGPGGSPVHGLGLPAPVTTQGGSNVVLALASLLGEHQRTALPVNFCVMTITMQDQTDPGAEIAGFFWDSFMAGTGWISLHSAHLLSTS